MVVGPPNAANQRPTDREVLLHSHVMSISIYVFNVVAELNPRVFVGFVYRDSRLWKIMVSEGSDWNHHYFWSLLKLEKHSGTAFRAEEAMDFVAV